MRHHLLPGVDFAVIHHWPDQWLQCCSKECLRPFLRAWLLAHFAAASDLLAMPCLVEEFGAALHCTPGGAYSGSSTPPALAPPGRKLTATPPEERVMLRYELYEEVYNSSSPASARNSGGAVFWLLGLDGVESDHYTVFAQHDVATAKLIRAAATAAARGR